MFQSWVNKPIKFNNSKFFIYLFQLFMYKIQEFVLKVDVQYLIFKKNTKARKNPCSKHIYFLPKVANTNNRQNWL